MAIIGQPTEDQELRRLRSLCDSLGSPRSVITNIPPPTFEKVGKRVRFAKRKSKTAVNLTIQPSIELTEDDVASLWYTKDEYRLFKRSQFFIVKMMEQGIASLEEDEELCPRGLEAKTKKGTQRRRQAIEEGWDVVLGEQERQWREKNPNAVKLSGLYHEVAGESSMEAFIRAKRDEQYVTRLKKDSWL